MKINMMNELNKPHVHIKDREKVDDKLKCLFEGGLDSLQVISDYDMTLSRYSINNQRCPSSHGILESGIPLTPEAKQKHSALNKKYRAIEIDPHMTVEEKIPYMLEWWGKSHESMDNYSITKSLLKEAVSKSNATLKEGCVELFQLLDQHSVPLLIFSAGLGDIIDEVIRQKSQVFPNMKLVSNFMDFNNEGVMVGFKGDLIHTFNKNEGALANSEYFKKIEHRHNIILLGDMMGDLNMADGVSNINTILKIGYLNETTPSSLEKYKEAWDIVLVEDPSVRLPSAIISNIATN